ncbi:E3 ubiquitin-protein ligase TRIM39-like [Coturnix japonica]|uniref:E3 ubiquitin-protein ligase TRIM39-like n=1 Tax=Coturnix japonica TaxID=93934 RepID=UPI0007780846|nr:E3 ubiquitin-protein ligase TRIM39-like [Coturnix japonica]
MSWRPELPVNVPAITIRESGFSNVPEHPTQHKSSVDPFNSKKERLSKLSNGEGIPERLERDPESQQNPCNVQELRKKFEPKPSDLIRGPEKPPQKESRVNSPKRPQESFSKQSEGNADPVLVEREQLLAQRRADEDAEKETMKKIDPESQQNSLSIQELLQKYESKLLTFGPETSPQKESRVNSQKRPQESFSKQGKGNADPVLEERGRTVEMSTSKVVESIWEEMENILNEKLAALQRQMEKTAALYRAVQDVLKKDLQMLREDLEERVAKASERSEFKESMLEVENQAVDVTLNADTAHCRLKVSEDGKSVNDTGVIRKVPDREERFDSHLFVLGKEGYTYGRYYWVVDVRRRKNWILGVASESVARKGTVTLSPKNGFWVIALADGQEYWAYTDPWTRLTVSGRPQKIGIFLNISANKLSFYNAKMKTALYTFNMGGSVQKRMLVPFFSTGSGASVLDTEPLKIM